MVYDEHSDHESIHNGMRYDLVLHETGIIEINVSQNGEPVQTLKMEYMAFKSINYAIDELMGRMVRDPGCYDGYVEPQKLNRREGW